MPHVIHFFCPGRPSDSVIARYQSALSPLEHRIVWHTPAGTSSAFTTLAQGWRRNGRCIPQMNSGEDATTISLIAFSAGYGAVREVLQHPADREDVDALVLLDGLHASFDADGSPSDAQLTGFAAYAMHAKSAENDALLWIGHTDVPTYGYASSADSAREVVRLADGEAGQFQVHTYDLYPANKAKREHAAALVEWGPGYVAEALVPHLSALSLKRQQQMPWRDSNKTIGERTVAWSMAQRALGSIETGGRNAGPIIASYHRGAKRRDGQGNERPVGLRSGDWCASGLCYAERRCLLASEMPVMPWRVSGIELQRDAAQQQLWRPVELARTGAWHPEVGDIALFVRPHTADPRKEWRRHVSRVSVAPSKTGRYQTVDANHGDRWATVERQLDDRALLGFIEYPRAEPMHLSEDVWAHVVKVSEDVMHGRDGLDYALRGLMPQELVA